MNDPAASGPLRPRHGPGLRLRLTALATGLVAAVSALLLWLGWLLVGEVVAAVPTLPPGSVVSVGGVEVTGEQLAAALRAHAQSEVLRVGVIAFCCVVLAAAVLAWTVAGRVLRPLHEVTSAAQRLSAESLGERLRLVGPRDEVAELADTFDAMLDRLQSAFDAQRRFVANASHELRTPLAVVRTELDVTLADPDADAAELRRMAGVVRQATARAEQLVDALLLLARTDGAALRVRERVDLAAVVASAWQAVRADADDRGLRVDFRCAPAAVLGDPALLERIAGNLLENAVRHNVDGGWVEVTVATEGAVVTEGSVVTAATVPTGRQHVRLRVASSGAPVPPGQVGELFEPFRRGGTARTGSGAGLGLSIVAAVAQAHGGTARAEPIRGGGLAVVVDLPTVAEPVAQR